MKIHLALILALAGCVVARGQTPPPAKEPPTAKENCAKLMESQRVAPKQSVFEADTFPVIDFPNKDLIEAALGPYTLKIRYFDGAYGEVEKPAAPDRYGARVEISFPNGYIDA